MCTVGSSKPSTSPLPTSNLSRADMDFLEDQPTYYHFHVHIVHVALEAGTTQATGKALGLENVISQLETMIGGEDAGMKDVCLTYQLGEASELWQKVFLPLKKEASAKGDGNNAS